MPSERAVSSPSVNASSPDDNQSAGTMQTANTPPSRAADDQPTKPVLPNKKICMARQISGRVSSTSVVTALSRKPTTMPASSRFAVCRTPRDKAMVRTMAAPAPRQAAPVMPSSPAQASAPNEASAASRLNVTPSAAPDAVPNR